MKKISFTFLLLLFCAFGFAQSNFFEGVVIDEQLLTPIEGALVSIEGTAHTEATDANGKFTFRKKLPEGQQGVSVEMENFDTKIFLINVQSNTLIKVDQVKLSPDKKENYRRKYAVKNDKRDQRIAEKNQEARQKFIEKELRKKEKANAKEMQRLKNAGGDYTQNQSGLIVEYTDLNAKDALESEMAITEAQKKYAKLIGVEPTELKIPVLYDLIEEWDDVTYKLGGVTRKGIDCSSFTQLVYSSIYNWRIERTALEQYKSEYNDEFKKKEHLVEGCLVFFTGVGTDNDTLNHVGVYLANGKFVHSTSNKDKNGKNGVQISDLNDDYWSTKFLAGGKLLVKRD